ncbi:TPA: beta-channel forming cytolysin [Bacillus cereus]|nr:beta-channel forming cytolysin [Bacillus cereus]
MEKQRVWPKNIKIISSFIICVTGIFTQNIVSYADTSKVEPIGSGASIYHNFDTTYDQNKSIKTSLKVSFINDPNSNKKQAVISTEGSYVAAQTKIEEISNRYSILTWPAAYTTTLELSLNDTASLYTVAPTNVIDSKTVTSAVGYTIGGNIKTVAGKNKAEAEAGLNVGTTWINTVAYQQSDYKTILEEFTNKEATWSVNFVSLMNQGYGPYHRESSEFVYGNQLFMKSRTSNNAKDNFISADQMPALVGYGFSPGILAVITADKNEKLSYFTIKYGRDIDAYHITWRDAHWYGTNMSDSSENSRQTYGLDWENNKLITYQ